MLLQKGQKCKLSDLTASKVFELTVNAGMKTGEADVTCFGVDSQDKLSDDRYFVFYNQTSTPEGAVSMKSSGTETRFSVDFTKLPSSIKKLIVTVAADQSFMREIQQGTLRLSDGTAEVASYSFSGDQFQQEKALILCEIYEKDGVWRISLVASGFNGGLSALLAHFGGEEAAPAPTPQPAPEPGGKAPLESLQDTPSTSQTPSNAVKGGLVSLKKSGDTHKISLSKNGKEIHVNLNWNINAGKKKGLFGALTSQAIDLDLACMYRLKDGQMGVIQALGNSFGSANNPPYIFLDQDDRTGTSSNGENMWFKRPELIDFAVVFAYIYEGIPNWGSTSAAVVLKQQGSPDIQILIDNSNNRDRFCVIASMTGNGDQLEVRREERFFADHKKVDHAYGFGFRWVAGRK